MLEPQIWTAVPFHFWSVVFFVFGSIVGSFLNVCIYRMPRGESIVHPPSHCPHCGYQIPWYLNIPLLTWLFLRGRCAHCAAPISFRYFLVELITAILYVAAWGQAGRVSTVLALIYCVFLAGLIVAFFIDLEHYIVPDEITLGGIAVGFLGSLAVPMLHGSSSRFDSGLRSALGIGLGGGIIYLIVRVGKVLFGHKRHDLPPDSKLIFGENSLQMPDHEIPYEDIFYRKNDTLEFQAKTVSFQEKTYENVSVRLTSTQLQVGSDRFNPAEVSQMEVVTDSVVIPREAMGFGDVKFMAAIGAFLGWQGVLFCMVMSSLLGALAGGMLVLYHRLRKQDYSTLIPYVPCIAVAAVVWLFWGPKILAWWLDLTLPPL
jgi:leader peptidase (prepilin peptidase)/N-methyltransferase